MIFLRLRRSVAEERNTALRSTRRHRPESRRSRVRARRHDSGSMAVTAERHATREPLSFAGLVVLTLGALDWGLEGSIIVPALPDLATHYDASLIATAWLVTAYVLVS